MSDVRNAPVREDGPAAPLLAVAGIEKSFPGVRALSGVSFEVAPGEVHALLGENGAGKSTLIKIISGVYQPDAGTIYVEGRPLRLDSPDDARRAGIATIYQELLLFRDLTVAENVFMGHAPRSRGGRLDWKAMAAKTEALLAALEIVDLAPSRIVGSLSVGNRQRVEILRALSQDARLLIMDEPTAALTEYDVTRLFDIVRRLKSRGVGIIYISHRMDEIFQLADRVTVLRDGAQVGTRRVVETSSAELVQMMVGRQIESLFPKVAVTPAESGRILVSGEPVQIRSPGRARALGIAYVPEDRATQGLVRPMNVRENFSLASLAKVARFGFIDAAAETRLAETGVTRFRVRAGSLDQVVGRLSGGNQQKIVLGKWLANQPKLLILDEPTRGIDVGAKAEIHRLMCELAAQGLAILMISSELPEVLGMSDRVLVMREGRLVAEFSRAEATPEAVGAAMMCSQGADAGRAA